MLCVHRPSANAINPEAPDRDKVYTCTKCGKTIKPVYGLGEIGSLLILVIIASLFCKSEWFNSLLRHGQDGWVWGILPWIGLFIIFTTIRYITLKYCIPVFRVYKEAITQEDTMDNGIAVLVTLLESVISCAQLEIKNINDGNKSSWTLVELEDVVLPEMKELLSHALNGKIFYKYGKNQRLFESSYRMTDSLEHLNNTALGRKISELQKFYNRL